MTRDDQRLLLIAHALSGAAHQSTESPADLARRAVEIASAVLELIRTEEERNRRQGPAGAQPMTAP
jgi:hypothetical protein